MKTGLINTDRYDLSIYTIVFAKSYPHGMVVVQFCFLWNCFELQQECLLRYKVQSTDAMTIIQYIPNWMFCVYSVTCVTRLIQ